MSKELKEISNWFKANKLPLYASKTNLMHLGTSKQTGSYSRHFHSISAHEPGNKIDKKLKKKNLFGDGGQS